MLIGMMRDVMTETTRNELADLAGFASWVGLSATSVYARPSASRDARSDLLTAHLCAEEALRVLVAVDHHHPAIAPLRHLVQRLYSISLGWCG